MDADGVSILPACDAKHLIFRFSCLRNLWGQAAVIEGAAAATCLVPFRVVTTLSISLAMSQRNPGTSDQPPLRRVLHIVGREWVGSCLPWSCPTAMPILPDFPFPKLNQREWKYQIKVYRTQSLNTM